MPAGVDHLLSILESFPWAAWRARLKSDLDPIYRDLVRTAATRVRDNFTFDDPFTASFATDYIGERIVQLEDFTRQNVSDVIRRTIDTEGAGALSSTDLAELVAGAVREQVAGYQTWRAARIARTETGTAYNHGTVLGVKQDGRDKVFVVDGDSDGPCADANGQIWSVADALAKPLEHPNCVRTFFDLG